MDKSINSFNLWDSISPEKPEQHPQLKFEIDKLEVIRFPMDFTRPEERIGEDNGKYCIFEVEHNGEKKVIMTSAYSLLRGFKQNEPLAGKQLEIVKRMESGKQYFHVSELSSTETSQEKQPISTHQM